MRNTVLRKVCNVINSCENIEQLKVARKYCNLYYKIYGEGNKWVIESHYNNKRKYSNRERTAVLFYVYEKKYASCF